MECSEDIFELLVECYDMQKVLSEILSYEHINKIAGCSDAELRCWLARALVFDEDAADVLVCLSQDECADVRMEALDSLSMFPCLQSFNALCSALTDKDEIARSIAAYGVGAIGAVISPAKAKNVLLFALAQEKNEYALIGIYHGLYLLGNRSYIDNILRLFISEDYHVRSTVLRTLSEILDIDNVSTIANFVRTVNANFDSCAVENALQDLQSALEKFLQHNDIGGSSV